MKLHLLAVVALGVFTGCESAPKESAPAPKPSAPAPPETAALKLPGIRVDTPKHYMKLEPEREERLRQSALAALPPGSEVWISGRRAPGKMMDGTVYVQRQLVPPLTPGGTTVRAELQKEMAELEAQLVVRGARVVSQKTQERDGGIEGCVVIEMAQRGQVAHSHLCSLMTMDEQRRLVGATVNCLGRPKDSGTCRRIVDSRRYDSSDALPLDQVIERIPPGP